MQSRADAKYGCRESSWSVGSGGEPAVDGEDAAARVAGLVGGEEERRGGDLLRRAGTAERHVLEQLRVARGIAEQGLGALLEEAGQAVGRDGAGIDAQHSHAVGVRRAT